MTQAERLIRNLCEERRLTLIEQERAALKAFSTSTPWSHLPSRVRELVLEHRRLEKRQVAICKAIKDLGYSIGYQPAPGKSLDQKDGSQRRVAITEGFVNRRVRVTKLRTEATIESLGKSATEAQGILKGLRLALGKV